jgi:hypothetical protein
MLGQYQHISMLCFLVILLLCFGVLRQTCATFQSELKRKAGVQEQNRSSSTSAATKAKYGSAYNYPGENVQTY